MERRALGAEARTLRALAEPASDRPLLFLDRTTRFTMPTEPTTSTYVVVAPRAQGRHGIADGDAEIGGHFSLCAGEAPPIVVGADGAKALMCGNAGVDGGAHVE